MEKRLNGKKSVPFETFSSKPCGRFQWVAPLSVAVLFLALRPFFYMGLDWGGDVTRVWYHTRQLFYSVPIDDVTHHTVRFSILLPATLARIVSDSWWAAYLAPLAASIGIIFLTFHLLRRYTSPFAAASVSLALVFTPMFIRSSTLISPSVFSMLYLEACFLFLHKYHLDGRYGWLSVSAVFMFLAYSAKITNLFFAVGLNAGVLFMFGVRPALVFSSILLSLYTLEHAVLYFMLDEIHGRIGVIMAKHFNEASGTVAASKKMGLLASVIERPKGCLYRLVMLALERFLGLSMLFKGMLVAFTGCFAFLLLKGDRFLRTISLSSLSFLFITFFGVKSFFPLIPFQPIRERYLYVIVPVGLICLGITLCGEHVRHRWRRLIPAALLGLPVLFVLTQSTELQLYADNLRFYHKVDQRISGAIQDGRRIVYPLVAWHAKRQMIEKIDDKIYWWIVTYFLPDEILFNRERLVVSPFVALGSDNGPLMEMHLEGVSIVPGGYYLDPLTGKCDALTIRFVEGEEHAQVE